MPPHLTETLPLIPLRDKVVFPGVMLPFDVGRRASVGALKHALATQSQVFLATQRDKSKESPTARELHAVGCVANVIQHLSVDGGHIRVLVEGRRRARLKSAREDDFIMATVEILDDEGASPSASLVALARRAHQLFTQYLKLHPSPPNDASAAQLRAEEPSRLADGIATHLAVGVEEKQTALELVHVGQRLEHVVRLLEVETEKLQIDRRIATRVKKQMDRAQREYYLNEKIKAIHKELGRKEDRAGEVEALRKRVEDSGMSPDAREKALEEVRRLESMPPVSAEATVSRNYLQWLLDVPWTKRSRGNKDIDRAARILDEDHHGLEKVKERILEHLAVRNLLKTPRGAILCFVGPPGVGKTSLARSIARATGREYVRLSLGGIRDEAEIRGHRRTYIGAFPGQIVQMMKKAGTVNPVFLLDEVDKVGMDFRGDPTAALLEVLDPEQNSAFVDHYLDVAYNLSEVLFIATANVMHPISPALQDRLEILPIPSYTHTEKVQIARRFLLPRSREAHGLAAGHLQIEDDALGVLIDAYTREAGVRNLEREIGSLCRKVARKVCKTGKSVRESVGTTDIPGLLGPPRFKKASAEVVAEVGAATGLAWTELGGQLLTVECTLMRGRGGLTLTGKLGDVMQESARAALSFVRSRALVLGLDPDFHRKLDIHIHLPEGAIPKDGPSAGITLGTALLSRLTSRPVRHDLAMTGEVTLRGKVLPVGGVREKLLAAYRAGLRTVLMPRENERDLEEISPEVLGGLEIKLVSHMDEVLALALLPIAVAEGHLPPAAPRDHVPERSSPTEPRPS